MIEAITQTTRQDEEMKMSKVMEIIRLRSQQRGKRVARGDRGMTLLEIMIVLALIGMVMSAIGVGLNAYFKKGQKKTAQITVGQISQAAQQYMMENNSTCPTSLDDLVANKNLTARQKKDPWGKEFSMKCPGTGDPDGVDIISSGPDKQDGTPDDIKSWEL